MKSLPYKIFLGQDHWHGMKVQLEPYLNSGIYILTDHNTHNLCLPVLAQNIPELKGRSSFSIFPGEGSKDAGNLVEVWNWLMKEGAARNSLLINLGGGVVSDLGGFAAATYKRGMPYLNIPTSLIGQVDAAIGGKTGINISGIKNQAGLFYDPIAVFINPGFLATLPEDHMRSGLAEIIKCAALSGDGFWDLIKKFNSDESATILNLIEESVNFKSGIISEDPNDHSARKMLNFGHTVGHALESYYNLHENVDVLHGEAIAAGMICEAYLSYKITGLSDYEMVEILTAIKAHFSLRPVQSQRYDIIFDIMDQDKKKTLRGTGFSLLEKLGKAVLDQPVDRKLLTGSLEFYNSVCCSDKY